MAPIVLPMLSIEAWNAMQWNGMKWYEESCTLDNKAFTHYSIIYVDRRRDPATSSSPFSRRISGMLCSMCRPERNWLPLEKCARKCRKSKSKRPRNPPPFPIVPTPFFFLLMKEHWRLIQTDFNEIFHNFVSWIDLNILLSFRYFFILRKKNCFFHQDAFFIFKCF